LFHAYKSQIMTFFSSFKYVHIWGDSMMRSMLGIVDPAAEEAKAELRKRQGEAAAEATAALDAARHSQDYAAIANVLVILGNSIAQTAHLHRSFSDPGAADEAFRAVTRTFMAAKDIYNAIGDKEGAANAIFTIVPGSATTNDFQFLDGFLPLWPTRWANVRMKSDARTGPNFGFAHSAGDSLSAILHDCPGETRLCATLRGFEARLTASASSISLFTHLRILRVRSVR
jgi:hypothetical protein